MAHTKDKNKKKPPKKAKKAKLGENAGFLTSSFSSAVGKHAGGRPPKYDDPKDMVEELFLYFGECESHKPFPALPTKAGLCLALGISREGYNRYKRKPEFRDAIKAAELVIENTWVQRLGGANATGAIFYLKAALGYVDRQDLSVKGMKGAGVVLLPTKHGDDTNTAEDSVAAAS